jgi:lysozyme family protein
VVDIVELKKANAKRWEAMKVTTASMPLIEQVAHRLTAASAKTRYQTVSDTTGVPWFIIAVIHEREASQSWKGNLAQGDPWHKPSIHVPKGRGPFESWEEAAIDALTNCAPHAARWTDWTAGGALMLLEKYNGLGYAAHHKPSPYIWAATNQYIKGKFVSDGHYDPNAIDHQLGCAALLNRMADIDDTVKFPTEETPRVS